MCWPQQKRAAEPSNLAPRQRKQVHYNEQDTPGKQRTAREDSPSLTLRGSDEDGGSSSEGTEGETEPEKVWAARLDVNVRLQITNCWRSTQASADIEPDACTTAHMPAVR